MYAMKVVKGLFLAGMIGFVGFLAGCGGGGAGGTTTAPPTTASPTVSLSLTTLGATITALTPGTTATLSATVKNAGGSPVSGALVTFTTDATYGVFLPAAGTAITNALGVATINISAGTTSGASTATATATWTESGAAATATASLNYSVTAGTAIVAMTGVGGAATTALAAGTPGTLTATVRDKNGTAVPNALVTFATDSNYATFTPGSGTALTNVSGIATMTINAGATSGAATATVTAVWKESGVDVSVQGAMNYTVSAAVPVPITISDPVFGANPISAYGTTSVIVTVGGITAPLAVSFTSTCASAIPQKAVLTPSVTTIYDTASSSYKATATYRDNGCAAVDTITATVNASISSTGRLEVKAPSAGSIQFISASPTNISLKGTGGVGRQESSAVKFKVLDSSGNPLSGTVNFSLTTTVGGIAFGNGLTTASATSDVSSGEVQIAVNSGTVATPVRVIATINATTISTLSDQLTISTGIPVQANTSLSASTFNIDGWRHDGVATTLTMRLADHFSNPVPDNTAVSFIAEGGLVAGSCLTTASKCDAFFTSQAQRPLNGRISVLAYAIGNESFTDLNGNGTVDATITPGLFLDGKPDEMHDANGASTDIGEAFLDSNEDNIRNPTETFIDFGGGNSVNPDGLYNGPDGFYSGILCTSGSAICSLRKTTHVFRNIVIVLSDSTPVTTGLFRNSFDTTITSLDLGGLTGCVAAGASQNLVVILRDLNGNALPAGTTVTIRSSNGTITFGADQVVPNTVASFLTAPTNPAFRYPVTIKNDSPTTAPCIDLTLSGVLTVTIDPPVGLTTVYSLPVNN